MGKTELVGRVVSNRMQKTVLVACDRLFWNSKLKVQEKRTSKIMAHDEAQQCGIGDMVRIQPLYRKLSKRKSHMVKEVVRKVPTYSQAAAAAQAEAFDARQLADPLEAARQQVDAAAQRLQAARLMVQQFLAQGKASAGGSSGGQAAA